MMKEKIKNKNIQIELPQMKNSKGNVHQIRLITEQIIIFQISEIALEISNKGMRRKDNEEMNIASESYETSSNLIHITLVYLQAGARVSEKYV